MRPAPSYVRTVLFLIMAVLIGVLYVTLPPPPVCKTSYKMDALRCCSVRCRRDRSSPSKVPNVPAACSANVDDRSG